MAPKQFFFIVSLPLVGVTKESHFSTNWQLFPIRPLSATQFDITWFLCPEFEAGGPKGMLILQFQQHASNN